MNTRAEPHRPMQDLLTWLPRLPITGDLHVDYQAADPKVLAVIGSSAETTMNVLHNGISSIGELLANSSPVVADGTIGSDALEALGHLLAELGALAAGSMVLAQRCRFENADYQPDGCP